MFSILSETTTDLISFLFILVLLFFNWLRQRLEKASEESYESESEDLHAEDPLKNFLKQIKKIETEMSEPSSNQDINKQKPIKPKPEPINHIPIKNSPLPTHQTKRSPANPLPELNSLPSQMDKYESGHVLDKYHDQVKPSTLLQSKFQHDQGWHKTQLKRRPSNAQIQLSNLKSKRQIVLYKEILDKPLALRSPSYDL